MKDKGDEFKMAVKASNQVSLVDITDAYSVMLTSEAFTFVGNTSGAPSGLTCTTQAVAYCGATKCSNVTISTITCPTGISATISNNNTESPTITFTTTATVTDACEATISVSVGDVTIDKQFSFSIAMKGDAGNLDDLNVTEKLNSELKVDGNSIALTTGHFTIDATNMKLDENGNAEFTGDVKAESFEFKDSLKMGFGQWGSSITLFDFSDPMHVDSSEDAYNVVIPNFSGTYIDNGTAFRNFIEGLDIQVPVTINTLNGRPYYPLPKEITEYRLVQPIYQSGKMVFGTIPLYRADLYTITSIYLLLPWDGATGFNKDYFIAIDKSTQGFCLISENNDVIRWVKDTKGMIGKYLYVVYSATCTV